MKVWMVGIVLLLSACGDAALQPIGNGDTIVAFGDSLTAGKGVSEAQAYPAVLSELTGLTVINAGVSGETTDEGLDRLAGVIAEQNPALLILFEGGNDILQNKNLQQTKANLNDMIMMAKQSDVQVVLVGVPRKALFSSTAKLYGELSAEHDVPMEGEIVSALLRKPAMKSDSVHFNAAGYRALAQAVATLLQEAGAID